VLFTAGDGAGLKPREPGWPERQGALVTQDWPGHGPVGRAHCLEAADVAPERPMGARVVFAFACYGAGSPPLPGGPALMARLPQRLLGHPAGGILAFVGHVDRAYGCSFIWPDAGEQREHFRSALLALTDGWRVGHAMDYFAARYMDLAVGLNELLNTIYNQRKRVDPELLALLWTGTLDARNYVVLGDPAVRATAQAEL
jgi:hypothetical protein